jgi:predicted lipoprotein with Yx(FWY)xxD motif
MDRDMSYAGWLRARRVVVGAATAGALALLTGVAAAGTFSSLGVAKQTVSGKPETIVVDGRGVTIYELGGESLAHLQCITQPCFKLFPPLKVNSTGSNARKAPGVPGQLSVMRRVRGGFFQLMLDRHPLYYYSGDKGRRGSTKGQGIARFAGSWHVIKAS